MRGLYWVTLAPLVMAGLITRLANQPINAVVIAWTPDAMPENWTELRNSWWFWHIVRTLVSIAALAGLVTAILAARNQHQG